MSGVPILPTGMTNEAFYKEQAEYWRQIARDDLAEVERLRKAIQEADAMVGALWTDLFNKDLVLAEGADYFDKWRLRIRALTLPSKAPSSEDRG